MVHSQACQDLTAGWRLMRWGKFKGRPIDVVPTRYLAFVLSKRIGSSDDRAEILTELRTRDASRYGTSEWTAKTLNVGRDMG